ncbi:transcriptional repressor [Pseudomonas sp. R2.Fl]|nr:transcriptional repressor [Pseudomonas sp. R2.Fl]
MNQALTRNQTLVLGVLQKTDQPLSAYTILDKLRDQGFRAPLQVYRALEKLLETGLVHRLESINSFVACAHPQESCCSHGIVAFAICNNCGHVAEFHDHAIDDRLQKWTASKKFRAEKTTIEIRGLCADCAA